MKVLVTGCSGYIGSRLIKKLLERKDWEVWGADWNNCTVDGRLNFVKSDIRKLKPEFIQQFDIIYHLAAQADIPTSFKKPDETFDINVNATQLLVKNFMGKRFVFASSSSVYLPTNPYAESKLKAEEVIKKSGAPYTILRYFNVYGWGKMGLVIQEFMKNTLEGKPLVIHGTGDQERDFVYVDDIVDATIQSSIREGGVNQIFDVGTGKAISLNQVVSFIRDVTGKKVPVTHIERRKGDLDTSIADIRKIETKIGWKPVISLKDGLGRMVNEYEP